MLCKKSEFVKEVGITIKSKETSSQFAIGIIHQPALPTVSSNTCTNKVLCSTSTRFDLVWQV